MTVTANGTNLNVTDGDGLRSCVRAPENPAESRDRPLSVPSSPSTAANTRRAIPDHETPAKANPTAKVRNFVSPHVGGVRDAVRGSWPLTESPQPLAVVARQVFPAKGEAGNSAAWTGAAVAGLFRLAVFTLAQLVQLAVATRIRAGVTLTLLVVAVAAGCVAH